MSILTVVLAVVVFISSCGQNNDTTPSSQISARSQVPADSIKATDVQSFIDLASSIRSSETFSGVIPVSAFLKLMPLDSSSRTEILKFFKNDFGVKCDNSKNICNVSTLGTPTQAVMNVVIDGIPNPSLVLDSTIAASFVIRGTDAIEFCETKGISVKKFFIKKTVQGLFLNAEGGRSKLIVNTGNDSENFTCR